MVASKVSKMDGRLEVVERDVGEIKTIVRQLLEDMKAVREYMKELTGWMRSGGNGNPQAEQAKASTLSGDEGGGTSMAANRFGNGPVPCGWEPHFRRMEIPPFNSEDSHGWLF